MLTAIHVQTYAWRVLESVPRVDGRSHLSGAALRCAARLASPRLGYSSVCLSICPSLCRVFPYPCDAASVRLFSLSVARTVLRSRVERRDSSCGSSRGRGRAEQSRAEQSRARQQPRAQSVESRAACCSLPSSHPHAPICVYLTAMSAARVGEVRTRGRQSSGGE
jgi:hypothetical protein